MLGEEPIEEVDIGTSMAEAGVAAVVEQAVAVVPLFMVNEHDATGEGGALEPEPSPTAAACAGGAGGAGKGKGRGKGMATGSAGGAIGRAGGEIGRAGGAIGRAGGLIGRGTGRDMGKPRRGNLTGAGGGAGGDAGGAGGVGGLTGGEGGAGAPAGGPGGAGGETGGEGGVGGAGGAGGPATAAMVGADDDVDDDESVDGIESVEVVVPAELIAAIGRAPAIGPGSKPVIAVGETGGWMGRVMLGSPAMRALDTWATASRTFESLSGSTATSDWESAGGPNPSASTKGFNIGPKTGRPSRRAPMPSISRASIEEKVSARLIDDVEDGRGLTQSHRGFSWGREIRGYTYSKCNKENEGARERPHRVKLV